jgi:hypothetical protein
VCVLRFFVVVFVVVFVQFVFVFVEFVASPAW